MPVVKHITKCPIAIVAGIYLLGLGGVAMLNRDSWRAPGWVNMLLFGSVALSALLVSRRGSANEDGTTIPEAVVVGCAALVYLFIGLIGTWSTGDQRAILRILAGLCTLSLVAFVGLHLMGLNWNRADASVGKRISVRLATALSRTPMALLWAVMAFLFLATAMFLLTPHGLDLSWLF